VIGARRSRTGGPAKEFAALKALSNVSPLEQLYRDRYVGFRNALAPIVGSREAAHDVVQEAFAVALREQRKLRRETSLAPWVWRIAYRLALRARTPAVETLPDDLTILDEHRDPGLAAAIRTLPPRRRLVVFLRYFAGFSYGEIAEALDIEPGTVAATLAQAHTALHDELVEVTR
jgi:RNA polymerase sigma factor (sigma-70 family)